MLSTFEMLNVVVENHLATVTITREAALNALSSSVINELTVLAAELDIADDVRVVILTGAGEKAFVAGADIAEMAHMSPAQAHEFAVLGGVCGAAIEHSHKPWIAAVNGFALGGGCELALACDIIYASDKALFGQPEVALGVIPGFGGTQRLLRRVGVAKAKELCMTGDRIRADEALRIGLADAVLPHAELMSKVVALANRIAKNGPLAVAEVKRLIHQGQSITLESGLALEQRSFGLLFSSEDQREGMAAFLGKRAAVFTGK